MKKHNIQVRKYARKSGHLFGDKPESTAETIVRKIARDSLGNFNRMACRYKGQTFLVHSDAGDIGDPFRANESYLETLFIDANNPCGWKL